MELGWGNSDKSKWLSIPTGVIFLVSFVILLEILSNLRGLTCKLQMRAVDVLYAYKEVKIVISTLENMREKSEQEFKRNFKHASKLGKDLNGEDFELSTP